MKQKLFVIIPAMMLLVMVGVAGAAPGRASITHAPLGVGASTVGLAAPGSPLAPVGSAFTYQGRLVVGNNPANGLYDFVFSLYDASGGGTQVGTQTLLNQTVTDGLFTVALDFGVTAFQGEARWMQISVKVAGGPSYTNLLPRVALTAAPYALSLMPGAVITGSLGTPGLTVFNSGDGDGLTGKTAFNNRAGVSGYHLGTGNGWGVFGSSVTSYGVFGKSGTGVGVIGESEGGQPGVYGNNTASGDGVQGSSVNGDGVSAVAGNGRSGVYSNNTGTGWGVFGRSTGGKGVQGETGSSQPAMIGINTGSGVGVQGNGNTGKGVLGISTTANGVEGQSSGANNSAAVAGYHTNGYGVFGSSTTGTAIYGVSTTGTAIYGVSTTDTGLYAQGALYGIRATGGDVAGGAAIYATSTTYPGVVGQSTNNPGVIGRSTSSHGIQGINEGTCSGCHAGWFQGKVHVTGTLSKSAGSFKIDHPQDPANKYLSHSFVESPDMKNIYDGVVALDGKGEAWVQMPEWFDVLNKEFRYQLTAIGAPGPNLHIAQKIADRRFKVAGGAPGMEVSWQVTGIRHDPYAEKHRIPVEEDKPANERGYYLQPELYGQPDSKSINNAPHDGQPQGK